MSETEEALEGIAEVLDFWFAPGREDQWFVRSDAFDQEVIQHLGPWYQRARAGELEAWRVTPEGALALVLLLDQVPRHLFRNSAEAYACDAKAREITLESVAAGLDRQLGNAQRLFLYLPLEHSEELADQEQAVALITPLGDEEATRYAVIHRDIIARFGRFPHRNAVLGRESTPEETEFLKQPNSSF
ncbi:MAG TPA: DUF924 family protein [Kiloniellales bacterium]|nr:DUF924 family protein [Kiloniellales bacterium]